MLLWHGPSFSEAQVDRTVGTPEGHQVRWCKQRVPCDAHARLEGAAGLHPGRTKVQRAVNMEEMWILYWDIDALVTPRERSQECQQEMRLRGWRAFAKGLHLVCSSVFLVVPNQALNSNEANRAGSPLPTIVSCPVSRTFVSPWS